jgi:hypothetical protein
MVALFTLIAVSVRRGITLMERITLPAIKPFSGNRSLGIPFYSHLAKKWRVNNCIIEFLEHQAQSSNLERQTFPSQDPGGKERKEKKKRKR